MKVTLRKASVLAQTLVDASKKYPLTKTVTVSIYAKENVDETIKKAKETLESNLQAAGDLIAASGVIRKLLGDANNRVGVDNLLAERASLDGREKLLATVGTVERDVYSPVAVQKDVSVVAAQLEALKKRAETSERTFTDSLTVSIVDEEFTTGIQSQLADIRKRKQAIADELLEKNTSNHVELPEDVVRLLRMIKVVD